MKLNFGRQLGFKECVEFKIVNRQQSCFFFIVKKSLLRLILFLAKKDTEKRAHLTTVF